MEKIIIPLEPLSINKVHCRDKRHTTSTFKEWTVNVLRHINKPRNQKAINAIKESFNPKNHYLKIKITSFYPREQMFTLSNQISSKVHDVSNIEKPLIDVVFTNKFHGTDSDYKGLNFNIDDKYIKEMVSKQLVSGDDSHLIEIEIEIVDLADLDFIA